MIKGLFETHLYVENIERSIDFYANTLELEQCHFKEERRAPFFWIGKPKQFMLGLWEKPKSDIDIRHFTFQCEPNWVLKESANYLKKRNITCRNFLNDGTERPMAKYDELTAYYIKKLSESLQAFQFKDVEYIPNKNKGYRSNGDRHPHSWAIIDTNNPIDWMLN